MNTDIPQQQNALLARSTMTLTAKRLNKMRTVPIQVLLLVGCTALAGCNTTTNTIASSAGSTSVMAETTESDTPAYNTEALFSNTSATAEDATTIAGCEVSAEQLTMIAAINQARSVGRFCGETWSEAVSDVAWSCALMDVAKSHSVDMATHNFFSHQGSNGLMVDERVTAADYAWRTVGENIAVGQSSVTEVVNDWLLSPGHCVNIMNADFQELGSWRIDTNNADYISYWTQVFAKPL